MGIRILTFPVRLVLSRRQVLPFLAALDGPHAQAARDHTGPRKIVMLVISEVWRDPRVEREARALAAAGFEIEILYPDYFSHIYSGSSVTWGERISFSPLPSDAYRYIFGFPYLFGRSYLEAAAKRRPYAFHCHDLNTALVGLAAARMTGAHCICDFHEWYSENVSWDPVTGEYVPHHFLLRS